MFLSTLMSDPIRFVRIVMILIISIVIHELAHGVAALSQGDDTPRVTGHMTPNPVVHMGYESLIFLCVAGIAWGAMPVNPSKFRHARWSDVLVSAAGPLSNFLLGILFVGLAVGLKRTALPVSQDFLQMAAYINMSLFIFNLLPLPPLDGFHVYSQFFPALKRFENSPIALFCLMLLFLVPTFAKWMSIAATSLILLAIGIWSSLLNLL